jgi:hypothetical protein
MDGKLYKYLGFYKDDLKHGLGKLYWEDGKIINYYEGNFANGEKEG